jgi:hypothetical protein
MKSRILVSAGLLVAALGIAAWLAIENHHLSTELDRAQIKLNSTARRLQAARQSVRRDAEPGRAMAVKALNQAPATSPAPRASMAKLWDDPDWRADRFNEAYLRVEARYGRFFQTLVGWSPERLEALKRQLANNDLALMRAGMLETYDSDGKATGDAVHQTEIGNEQQLKESLGDADYAAFDGLRKMDTYRESVSAIANSMRSKNVQVSNDMEESILRAYASAIQEAAQQASPIDIRQLNHDQLAALKGQQTNAFRILLLNRLSGVLNEKQISVFMEAEIEQEGGS